MAHDASSDNPYTHGIAEFVSGLQYDAIPEDVRSRIKLLMLDSLGCALYGTDLEWTRILQETLAKVDTTRTCAVWGTNKKLSAPHTALANGTQVQGFQLDDVHRAGVLHVGAVVESARGSEYKFASEADIVEKFEKLAAKVLPKSQIEQLRDAMLGLDKLGDATRIAQLLAVA